MTTRILLVCGAGASSGFMAAAARKAAKQNGNEFEIKAKSESELDNNLDTTDYRVQKWSELENVRYFYDFFMSGKDEFDK